MEQLLCHDHFYIPDFEMGFVMRSCFTLLDLIQIRRLLSSLFVVAEISDFNSERRYVLRIVGNCCTPDNCSRVFMQLLFTPRPPKELQRLSDWLLGGKHFEPSYYSKKQRHGSSLM
jgi:hypothetical protein